MLGRGWASRALPLLGFMALAAGFLFELARHLPTGGDFWTFWAAARALGAGLDPYRAASLTRVTALPPGPAPGPFLSPLFLAELMRPLGALPFATARLLWLILNLALSALLLLVLLQQGGFRRTVWSVLAGAALLMAFQPYDITLWIGQTDVLVAAALAVAWVCLERDRPLLAGLAAALAAIDVHLLMGFAFYLLYRAVARRDARPMVGLAAGLAVETALCLLHPGDTVYWLLVTLPHAQAAAIEPWDTLSALQAASELVGARVDWAVAVAVGLGMVGLSLAAWRRPGATPQRDLAVATVLTLATTTFAYNQDYLLLVLAFPFLAQCWRQGVAPAWTGALALCLAAGFGLAQLTGGLVAPSHAGFVIGAPVLALGILGTLPGFRGRLAPAHRRWAAAWVALTLGGYIGFTLSRWEVGPEILLLSGLLAFMLLVGAARAGGKAAGLDRAAPLHPGAAAGPMAGAPA